MFLDFFCIIFLYFLIVYCIIYLSSRNVNKVELLGCTTTPVILNLHLFSWGTDIYKRMSCLHRLDGRILCEVSHLAWLGLKIQEPAPLVVLLKNREVQRIDGIHKIRLPKIIVHNLQKKNKAALDHVGFKLSSDCCFLYDISIRRQ